MDFSGPEAADFANVMSINHAFLRRLRESTRGRLLRQQMVASAQPLLRGLTDLQIDRLAAAPFLLLSLRERDDDYWQDISADSRAIDLLSIDQDQFDGKQLDVAALAFLWQLARRNPYAARLVSGASIEWSEQLANCTLLQLLQRTTMRNDMLQPRLAANADFWTKLLGPGLSSKKDVRAAAHLAALQTVLTDDSKSDYQSARAAACRSQAPSLRVADKRQH